MKASLATIAAGSGYPYASLITVATEASGAPVFLISRLAQHTKNLAQDPRASILFDGTGAAGDPLQGARVTLYGKAEKTGEEAARRRFLARHPEAAFYADFPDFAFWRLEVEGAHYIGGFGRIVDLSPAELLVPTEGAEELLAAEPGIIEHMNEDHADAVRLYATRLAGAPEGFWRMSGIDPEGCDLIFEGDARRIRFRAPDRHAGGGPGGTRSPRQRGAGAGLKRQRRSTRRLESFARSVVARVRNLSQKPSRPQPEDPAA